MPEQTLVIAEVVPGGKDPTDLLEHLDQTVGMVGKPHLGQVEIIVEGVANLDDAREKVAAAATAFDPAWGERLHFVAQ